MIQQRLLISHRPPPPETAALFKNRITEEADGGTANVLRGQHLPAKPGRGPGAVTERQDFMMNKCLRVLETEIGADEIIAL